MKAFIPVFLAVAALAEPQWPIYGSPLIKPLTYGFPTAQVKYVDAKPVEYKQVEENQEAEVETYAQKEQKVEVPVVTYNTQPFAYNAHPLAYNYQPVVAHQPIVYASQQHIVPAKYHAKNEGVEHTVFKREAESFYPYTAGISPYTAGVYSQQYAPSVYSQQYVPTVYNQQYVPTVYNQQYVSPVLSGKAATYANDFVKPVNYAAKGQYVAQSAGAIHIAKREAESQYLTTSPLAYTASYPYNTYANQYVAARTSPYVSTYASGLYNGVYNTPYNTPYNYVY